MQDIQLSEQINEFTISSVIIYIQNIFFDVSQKNVNLNEFVGTTTL